MKNRLLTLLGLLGLICLAAPLHAQTPGEKFSKDFNQAIEFGDTARADKVLRNNVVQAFNYFQEKCWSLRAGNSGARATMDALKESWGRVYSSSRTLVDCEAWIGGITQSIQDRMYKAEQAQYQLYQALEAARKSKQREDFLEVKTKGIEIAELLANLGNVPKASETWIYVSAASSEIPEPTVQDRRDAIFALEQFLAQRDRWQWDKDSSYAANKGLVQGLREKLKDYIAESEARKDAGFTGNEKGIEAYLDPDGEEQVAELEFELLRRVDDDDVSPFGGQLPQLWTEAQFRDVKDRDDLKKDRTKLLWFIGQELFLRRDGASISLEVPGVDGTQELDMGPKLKPNLVYFGPDRTKPYGLFVWAGTDQETFFHHKANMAWTEDFAPVFYKSASSWKAEVGGEDVWFYDDDADGIILETDHYAVERKMYSLGNPADGTIVPSLDSMRIGKKGKRVPFSEYAQIDDTWYHVRAVEDQTKVSIRPLSSKFFKTGTIEYEWEGNRKIKPDLVVVQEQGTFHTAVFDVTEGEVEVPVGDYKVVFGRIQAGKKPRLQQAQLFPGSMEAIKVEEGKTTPLVLGEDMVLDWTREGEGQTLQIDGTKLQVKDSTGVLYANLFNCTLSPDVVWSPKEGSRGGKPIGSFLLMDNLDFVNAAARQLQYLGRWVGAFPMPEGGSNDGSMLLSLKLPRRDGWVALQELKNPLFGRLGLVWKQ